VQQFLANVGTPMAGFMAWVVALVKFVGGFSGKRLELTHVATYQTFTGNYKYREIFRRCHDQKAIRGGY
jgi:hypothetical protein